MLFLVYNQNLPLTKVAGFFLKKKCDKYLVLLTNSVYLQHQITHQKSKT